MMPAEHVAERVEQGLSELIQLLLPLSKTPALLEAVV
jgi:hypothetical protein